MRKPHFWYTTPFEIDLKIESKRLQIDIRVKIRYKQQNWRILCSNCLQLGPPKFHIFSFFAKKSLGAAPDSHPCPQERAGTSNTTSMTLQSLSRPPKKLQKHFLDPISLSIFHGFPNATIGTTPPRTRSLYTFSHARFTCNAVGSNRCVSEMSAFIPHSDRLLPSVARQQSGSAALAVRPLNNRFL